MRARRKAYIRRRRYGRRPYRRIGRRGRTSTQKMWVDRGTFMPPSIITKMTCRDKLTITGTGGSIDSGFLRGNDVLDPRGAAGSECAYGFHELAQIYTKFTVLGSKIKLTFFVNDPASDANSRINIIVFPSRLSAPLATMEEMRQLPMQKSKWLTPDKKTKGVTSYCSTSRVYQVSKQEVADDVNYSGTSTTSPSYVWNWFWSQQCADMTAIADVTYYYEITYYVKWSRREHVDDVPFP